MILRIMTGNSKEEFFHVASVVFEPDKIGITPFDGPDYEFNREKCRGKTFSLMTDEGTSLCVGVKW